METAASVSSLEKLQAVITVDIAGETFPIRIELQPETQQSPVPDKMKEFSNSKTLPFGATRSSNPDPVKTQPAPGYTLDPDPTRSGPIAHPTTRDLPDIRGHGTAGLTDAYPVAIGPSIVSPPNPSLRSSFHFGGDGKQWTSAPAG